MPSVSKTATAFYFEIFFFYSVQTFASVVVSACSAHIATAVYISRWSSSFKTTASSSTIVIIVYIKASVTADFGFSKS